MIQKGQPRPWRLLLRRWLRQHDTWGYWHTYATFGSEQRATEVGRREVKEWDRLDYDYQFCVKHRDDLTEPRPSK